MLDDLTLFIEVAQRGSFAKTAEDLNMSPSGLSKRISKLEERFGAPLMTRSARGVVLTSFGKLIFDDIADTIFHIKEKVLSFDKLQQDLLTVLCPQNLMAGPMFQAISQFQYDCPSLQLRIEPDNRNVLTSQKRFDVAFRVGEQEDSSLFQKRVGSITVQIVGQKPQSETPHLFVPYKSKLMPKTDRFNKLISAYNHVHYVGDISLARQFVAAGNGAGLLPSTEIQVLIDNNTHKLHCHSEVLFTRPIYALWPNSHSPSQHVRQLIKQISTHCDVTPALRGDAMFNASGA